MVNYLISLRPCSCQISLFHIVVTFCLAEIWLNWTLHASNLLSVRIMHLFIKHCSLCCCLPCDLFLPVVGCWLLPSQARIKHDLQLVVGGSWCWTGLYAWNQTLGRLGQATQLQQIKQGGLCTTDRAVAGLGLADGPSHPCALYQTGPSWLGFLCYNMFTWIRFDTILTFFFL